MAGRALFTVQDILDSYAPPEAEFDMPGADLDEAYEEDAGPFTVEIPTSPFDAPASLESPKFKSGSVAYSYSEPGRPSSRTIKTTYLDLAPLISKAGVRGVVSTVAHGTFHAQPSSLIVFSFALRSGDHGFRFENAHVKITFSKHPTVSSSQLSPVVVKFAPRKIFGLPTVEGKRNKVGGEVSLQVPAGPLTIGPTISGERESEYEKEHRYKCVGNYWSSKHAADWDIVYWDLKENKRTKQGIPDRLNVAVVVEREGMFTANVEVSIDTPLASGIFAFPWSKNQPVEFSPSILAGPQPRTNTFDDLMNEDWRFLIPYEDEWENKFTEETMRSITPTSAS